MLLQRLASLTSCLHAAQQQASGQAATLACRQVAYTLTQLDSLHGLVATSPQNHCTTSASQLSHRQLSHASASTSTAHHQPINAQPSPCSTAQWTHPSAYLGNVTFVRGLKVLRRRFKLPDEIQQAVTRELEVVRSKPAPPAIPAAAPRDLVPSSRRVGCIAYKVGMTQDWDEHGVRVPLTVLWIDDCQVVGYKWPALHGYWALQVGMGYSTQKNLHPGEVGFYLKQGVPFKAIMTEFQVSEDAVLPVGTQITAAHYVPGQSVDITGWTKNKGFQGVMKRWGFKGLPASHGVSLAHRSPGSIGQRSQPGKVWKGKKMPGQMGDERRTVHDVTVFKVDAARNLVYVRGQVPGPKGQHVLLRDAFNTRHGDRLKWGLPHPTYCGEGAAVLSDVGKAGVALALSGQLRVPETLPQIRVLGENKNPYIPYSKETDYFEVKWKKSD